MQGYRVRVWVEGRQLISESMLSSRGRPALQPLLGSSWLLSHACDAGAKSCEPLKYTSFGAAFCEVEMNLLTGEKTILQSDLYFDCGRSLNPAVDIGQVSF